MNTSGYALKSSAETLFQGHKKAPSQRGIREVWCMAGVVTEGPLSTGLVDKIQNPAGCQQRIHIPL